MADWYYIISGQQRQGPVSLDEMRKGLFLGKVGPRDLVWREGMDQWLPADTVPELMGVTSNTGGPPPMPPRAAGPSAYPGSYPLPDRGALLLVFGILGITGCAPLGIAAFVMAGNDQRDIEAGQRPPAGLSLVRAGRILGGISIAILAINCLFVCLWFGFIGTAFRAIH